VELCHAHNAVKEKKKKKQTWGNLHVAVSDRKIKIQVTCDLIVEDVWNYLDLVLRRKDK